MMQAFKLTVECFPESSDMDSGRSDTVFVRRPGTGRRKCSNPWRSPWDASVCTVYTTSASVTSAPRTAEPAPRTACLTPSSRSPVIIVQHKEAPAAHKEAAQQQVARKKSKQELCGPCCHCGATSSPQWRKGPKGKPILCNACGIRFLRTRSLGKVQQPRKRRMAIGATTPDDDYVPPMSVAAAKRAKREADESASDDTLLAVKQEVGSDASSSPSLSASGVVAGPAAGAVSGMEAASSAEMDDVIMQQVELAAQLHPALQQLLAAHGLVNSEQQVYAIQRCRSKGPSPRAVPHEQF